MTQLAAMQPKSPGSERYDKANTGLSLAKTDDQARGSAENSDIATRLRHDIGFQSER